MIMGLKHTNTVLWQINYKIYYLVPIILLTTLQDQTHLLGAFIVVQPFKRLFTLWVYNKSHLQFDISYPCTVNLMKFSLSFIDYLYGFNLVSPRWITALLSDGNLYMCVYRPTGCGYTLFVVDHVALLVWLRAMGRLHSGNQLHQPLSSASIYTFTVASTLSVAPNGA